MPKKNKEIIKCLNCDKILIYSPKYCSGQCQSEWEFKVKVKEWKSNKITYKLNRSKPNAFIRKYLFIKYENKCCQCGWCKVNQYSKQIPLEINHIDGNWENNKEENLELLCPNCHSLTPNFRALNKGNGRKGRK